MKRQHALLVLILLFQLVAPGVAVVEERLTPTQQKQEAEGNGDDQLTEGNPTPAPFRPTTEIRADSEISLPTDI